MKLFGREPAAVLAFFASAIMILSQFFYPLTIDQQGGLNATAMALVGIITAWTVAEDGGIALILGLTKAVVAVAISFGLNWSPETQGVFMTFVVVTSQLFVRSVVVAPITASGEFASGKTLT